MSIALASAPLLHASLAVDDLAAARAFFAGAFGYRETFAADRLGGAIARLAGVTGLDCDLVQMGRDGDAVLLELVTFRPGSRDWAGAAPPAHLAFAVPDLDAAMALARAHGAEPMGEVVTFSEGRSAYLRVPGGAAIELEELA